MTKDDQKNSRKNKLIIHLYGIQQTGMENIRFLLILTI